jgi:AraC family transcriptional regulator, melibiose operon regulatory protein
MSVWGILFRVSKIRGKLAMDPARRTPPGRPSGLPPHERQFYAQNRAFGRFGMRLFRPALMEAAHWHGHIEINLCRGAEMLYDFNGQPILVPADRCICFWAGVPHQLLEVHPAADDSPLLCNIYLPVDSFLLMPFIGRLQVALLSGAIVQIPAELCGPATIDRWYADYRSGSFERVEVVKMELNAAFRRLLLEPLRYLVAPEVDWESERSLSSTHVRHAIEMVRFILENLDKPLKNAEIAAVTGLHENYAIALFSRIMRIPPRQFMVRMRLMRARALLVESSMAIPSVAEASGFSSISQFYHRFREAYGVSPREMRDRYVRMEL